MPRARHRPNAGASPTRAHHNLTRHCHPRAAYPPTLSRKPVKVPFSSLETREGDCMMVIERELTANQRNLVDTCFEEGNYEAAISALDKLRHPTCKPYA